MSAIAPRITVAIGGAELAGARLFAGCASAGELQTAMIGSNHAVSRGRLAFFVGCDPVEPPRAAPASTIPQPQRQLSDTLPRYLQAVAAPRVLFLGLNYAGHRTRFMNLRANTSADTRIFATYKEVNGWMDGGHLERLPLVPRSVKGRLRAMREAAAVARLPRPDVIWTSAFEVLAPYLWCQVGPFRRPLVYDLDCTFEQLEDQAEAYFDRAQSTGWKRARGILVERLVWKAVTKFVAWSNWAAAGLRKAGIPDERITVLPPGVDLNQWRPRPELRHTNASGEGPLRLLFVGADFRRKGGPLLTQVIRERFRGRCELDVVTRDDIPASPGIRVHRAEPNSAELRALYGQADLFVLPTRAECFGIATVEAMASGLPVIMGDVGGARDIVDSDRTGWLIQSNGRELCEALESAVQHRARLPHMGDAARRLAEERFDGHRNDQRLVDLLLEQTGRCGT